VIGGTDSSYLHVADAEMYLGSDRNSGKDTIAYIGMHNSSGYAYRHIWWFDWGDYIPVGAQIISATLDLYLQEFKDAGTDSVAFCLGPIKRDWVEGTLQDVGCSHQCGGETRTDRGNGTGVSGATVTNGTWNAVGMDSSVDCGGRVSNDTVFVADIGTRKSFNILGAVIAQVNTPSTNFGIYAMPLNTSRAGRRFHICERENVNASRRPSATIKFVTHVR
jgi:hypothetical protein